MSSPRQRVLRNYSTYPHPHPHPNPAPPVRPTAAAAAAPARLALKRLQWLVAALTILVSCASYWTALFLMEQQQQQQQGQDKNAGFPLLFNRGTSNNISRTKRLIRDENPNLSSSWSKIPLASILSALHDSNNNNSSTVTNDSSPVSFDKVLCFQDSCLQEVLTRWNLVRAFSAVSHKSEWCIPAPTRNDMYSQKTVTIHHDNGTITTFFYWQGLILVKVPKAASSTTAGAILRLANHSQCAVQYQHREAWEYGIHLPTPHRNRSSSKAFLIGSIRNPGQRAFSTVWFFLISPLNITPSDDNIIRAMNTRRGGKTKGKGGYQYNYLSLERVATNSAWSKDFPDQVQDPQALYARLHRLIHQHYNFLLVVERLDESLVALALLLNVPVHYVLYTSSKVASTIATWSSKNNSNTYVLNRFGPKRGQCYQPRKLPMSQGVANYLESPIWRAMNHADYILYKAAEMSLNLTIQQTIGRDKFDAAYAEYQTIKAFTQDFCGPIRLGTGCHANRTPVQPVEPCYDRDFNCGYQCMDDAVQAYYYSNTNKHDKT